VYEFTWFVISNIPRVFQSICIQKNNDIIRITIVIKSFLVQKSNDIIAIPRGIKIFIYEKKLHLCKYLEQSRAAEQFQRLDFYTVEV